jgi:16S rRNA (cytidine1402-2'-O)-methyltransferase
MSAPANKPVLYLLPVWLGEAGGIEQLPPENIAVAARVKLFFTEHEKTARHMLRRMVPAIDLSVLEMHRLDKDSTHADIRVMMDRLKKTGEGAIISEAGMPGIADPGAKLVLEAHRNGVEVIPLPGPSSLFLALAASGLNGQQFTFHGYLPRTPHERKNALRKLESEAQRSGAAQLFIETPYRNDALLADLLQHCSPAVLLTIAIDLTQPGGSVRSLSVAEWKKVMPVLGKRPAVFILGGSGA